jgi:hypothetical protein
VFLQLLEVFVLLLKLLLKLHELLLLTHSDGIVLIGFLPLRECISVRQNQSAHISEAWEQEKRTLMPGPYSVELLYHLRPWLEWWLRRQLGIEGWNEELGGQLEQGIVDT